MSYDVPCPSCHARLNVKDGTGDEVLICPRCLNVVPNPAVQAGALAATARSASSRGHSVPSVGADARNALWLGYLIAVGITVLAIIGIIASMKHIAMHGDNELIVMTMIFALSGLMLVLTALILFPAVYGLIRSTAQAARSNEPPGRFTFRTLGVVGLLLVLCPVALFMVCFTVCWAAILAP